MQKLARRERRLQRPKGIQRVRRLPDPELGTLWDSIVIEEGLKQTDPLSGGAELHHALERLTAASFRCTA